MLIEDEETKGLQIVKSWINGSKSILTLTTKISIPNFFILSYFSPSVALQAKN